MHMKKIVLSCILLFGVSACSQKDDISKVPVPNDSTSNLKKKDKDKDYLYSSNIYTVELSDEQKSFLKKDINIIHDMIINIDSKDADEVNKIFAEIAENHRNDIQKSSDGTIRSFIGYSGTFYESDKFISIVTTEFPYVWQSGKQPELYHTYIFNREDGTLCTQKELLAAFKQNEKTIVEQAKKILQKNGDKICGDIPAECYQEPMYYDENDNEQNTAIYVDKNNDLVMFVKKQHGLVYNWEPLILPQ